MFVLWLKISISPSYRSFVKTTFYGQLNTASTIGENAKINYHEKPRTLMFID